MYDIVLVPIDGSDPAERAVEHAVTLAAGSDADVHTLFVVDTRRYGEPAMQSTEIVLDDLESRGEELVHSVESRGREAGVETTGTVRRGAPHREIIDYADEIDADLLVLGYQGHTKRTEDAIGSTAERVVRHGRRPVLVV